MLQYDLAAGVLDHAHDLVAAQLFGFEHCVGRIPARRFLHVEADAVIARHREDVGAVLLEIAAASSAAIGGWAEAAAGSAAVSSNSPAAILRRSEEHTSELQSLMRNSYAVFCLKHNNTI